MVGVGALLGDVGACMGLIVRGGGSFQLLGHPIMLVFGSEVVGRNSAAFGVVSLANGAVVGLGRIGSSLGMVGA